MERILRKTAMYLCIFSVMLYSSCTRMPITLDQTTYTEYKQIVEKQTKENKCPMIGLYRVMFAGAGDLQKPGDAISITGDFRVAAVKRGAYLDFISLSGYKNYDALSDQGPSFSVNLQGSTLWSFPYVSCGAEFHQTRGTYSGLLNNKPGESIGYNADDGWIRIVTEHKPRNDSSSAAHKSTSVNEVKLETVFLRRTQE
jgi:hypothetical protein